MSTLTVTNIKATGETASRAVSGVAAAWIHLDETTATIENSNNISSVADNGTGQFTHTYSNAMSDADVAVGHATRNRTVIRYYDTTTTSTFAHGTETAGGGVNEDDPHTCLVIMGDLA